MDNIILTSEEHSTYMPTYLIAENSLSEISNIDQARTHLKAVSQDDFNNLILKLESAGVNSNTKWYTSGPVETTVGFLEDGVEIPSEMTIQDIMNKIFYTRDFVIDVPDSTLIGTIVDIGIRIRQHIGENVLVQLYQNEDLIKEFTYNYLEQPTILIPSNPINKDTEFKLKAFYADKVHEETKIVKCKLPAPIFVGAIPKNTQNELNFEYFQDLIDLDPINNKLVQDVIKNKVKMTYNFVNPKQNYLLIAIPETESGLEAMVTVSQKFGPDSFDLSSDTYTINGYSVKYNLYKYKQPLASLNQTIIFKLIEDELVQ